MRRDQRVGQDETGFNFDKFMDAILVEEAQHMRGQLTEAAADEPQRRRAWLRQERPLSRTYMRSSNGAS
jgi:hypothetical protein